MHEKTINDAFKTLLSAGSDEFEAELKKLREIVLKHLRAAGREPNRCFGPLLPSVFQLFPDRISAHPADIHKAKCTAATLASLGDWEYLDANAKGWCKQLLKTPAPVGLPSELKDEFISAKGLIAELLGPRIADPISVTQPEKVPPPPTGSAEGGELEQPDDPDVHG